MGITKSLEKTRGDNNTRMGDNNGYQRQRRRHHKNGCQQQMQQNSKTEKKKEETITTRMGANNCYQKQRKMKQSKRKKKGTKSWRNFRSCKEKRRRSVCLCAPQWCLLSTVLCANIVCTLCPEEKSCPTIVRLFGEKKNTVTVRLRASPPTLSMWPCKNISHIQVLVTNFFPTPPIKLKLGLQVGGRLLITTHLDQSNYLANQKLGAVNYLAYHSCLTPINS